MNLFFDFVAIFRLSFLIRYSLFLIPYSFFPHIFPRPIILLAITPRLLARVYNSRGREEQLLGTSPPLRCITFRCVVMLCDSIYDCEVDDFDNIEHFDGISILIDRLFLLLPPLLPLVLLLLLFLLLLLLLLLPLECKGSQKSSSFLI